VAGTEAAVPEHLVRLSVGLESVQDLIDDLAAALGRAWAVDARVRRAVQRRDMAMARR